MTDLIEVNNAIRLLFGLDLLPCYSLGYKTWLEVQHHIPSCSTTWETWACTPTSTNVDVFVHSFMIFKWHLVGHCVDVTYQLIRLQSGHRRRNILPYPTVTNSKLQTELMNKNYESITSHKVTCIIQLPQVKPRNLFASCNVVILRPIHLANIGMNNCSLVSSCWQVWNGLLASCNKVDDSNRLATSWPNRSSTDCVALQRNKSLQGWQQAWVAWWYNGIATLTRSLTCYTSLLPTHLAD